MVTVVVLFGSPLDETEFDAYFEQTHQPLLDRLPGTGQVTVHRVGGAVMGASPYRVHRGTGLFV